MKYLAVIDTNVLLSALLSKKADTATVRVLDAVNEGIITPLFHQEILEEYNDVLRRPKFHLQEETVDKMLRSIQQYGLEVFPQSTGETLIDQDDLIFYEVTMEKHKEGAYLVTGNQKHYPVKSFIVTPAEMIRIIDRQF